MFNKLFHKERISFNNSFHELKSIMNNFINFWTSIRKELFFRLKKSLRKITVKWSPLRKRLNKQLKRLSQWKRTSLSLGMILFLLLKNINTGLSLRHIMKSTKLIKISSPNPRILNYLKLEWENLTSSIATQLVKLYKRPFKWNGKTSKNKKILQFNYRNKNQIWVSIPNKVTFHKTQCNALKRMRNL